MSQYRMPAQWELQDAVWLSWPHNAETWPENLPGRSARLNLSSCAARSLKSQPVNVMAGLTEIRGAAVAMDDLFSRLGGKIRLVPIETNDAWARDYAPTFVVDEADKLVAIDWDYNAWGGKYPPFDADQKVAAGVADRLQIEVIKPGLCFEGGGIEVNGVGTMLTTASCVLNANRNPGLSRDAAEKTFRSLLGVENIVWLPGGGVDGDDTDGHIDQLARFTNETTIVYAWTESDDDPRRVELAANFAALKIGCPDAQLIPLLLPPIFTYCGRVIPASYCNFLIINERVLVPQFGFDTDVAALDTLSPLFPDRELVPLASKNLTVGLGSFHCLSQHQPMTT